MKTNLLESPSRLFREFTGLIVVSLLLSLPTNAQISYTQDFEGGPAGWTGNFSWSSLDKCGGTYSMLKDFDNVNTNGELASPSLGVYGVGGLMLAVSFDYKIVGGTLGFGTIDVQYSTSSSGPWTTAYTIDNTNHIVSSSCARVSLPLIMMPANTNVFIRFNVTWASGIYTVVIDNVLTANKWHTDYFVTGSCWGLAAVPSTFYYGVSQWYWFKNKIAGGTNYTWTNVGSGTLKPGATPYAVYLFEPTGPTVVTCIAEISPGFTYTYVYNMAWDNQYFAYKLGYTWYLKICEGGISKDVPWSEAKTKVCGGLATLGYCVPKTDLVSSGILTMEVFPNPSIGELTISLANAQPSSTISIYDLNSNLVLFENIETVEGQFSRAFDLSYLPNGLYFIQVNDSKAILTEKVVVSH